MYNKKYIANKKNGGVIPHCYDNRVLYVPIKCGNCMECRKQIARNWRTRLLEEVRQNKNGIMVSLTFSDESIMKLSRDKRVKELKGYEKDNKVAKLATRLFLENWRSKYGRSLRHWLVSELGSGKTEHLHLHGIIWTNENFEEIRKKWKYGFVWRGDYVNESTASYITKYLFKKDKLHENYKSIILTSPGIGGSYIERKDAELNKYIEGKTIETYRSRTGHKMSMPIYYRNKIYNEEEREKLWLEKLDKNERWVNGIKVDISKNDNEYYELLKEARTKSKKLGYGNDEKDWDKIRYENQRRELKIKDRAIKGYAKTKQRGI
jgi:hypothetical protein